MLSSPRSRVVGEGRVVISVSRTQKTGVASRSSAGHTGSVRSDLALWLADRAEFERAIQVVLDRRVLAPGLLAVVVVGLDSYAGSSSNLAVDPIVGAAAGRLRAATRQTDTVAVLGGGRFGIIADLLMSAKAISGLAQRLVTMAREPYVSHPVAPDHPIVIQRASAGVAVTGNPLRSPARLIQEAVDAYEQARLKGGDRIAFADPDFRRLLDPEPPLFQPGPQATRD
jgi:GGDEF domain-containing protein